MIALATVASLIDDAGLGVPILTAISNDVFKTELIAAGALAVGLALAADALLVLGAAVADPVDEGRLMQSFIDAFKFIGRNGQVPGRAAAADARPPDARDAEDRRRSGWRSRS